MHHIREACSGVLRWRSDCHKGGGTRHVTLKITIDEGPIAVTLKLEGRVAGPWVKEFQRTWGALAGSLGSRTLAIDLCGVTHIDPAGRDMLAVIHAETGAKFLADTPMTKYFAEEASRGGNSAGRNVTLRRTRCEDRTASK